MSDIDREIYEYPFGTIFEIEWQKKASRTRSYMFKKINNDVFALIELIDQHGNWKDAEDHVPNWEREGRIDMFASNKAKYVTNHGVKQ